MTVIKRFDFLHRQILRHGLGNVTKPAKELDPAHRRNAFLPQGGQDVNVEAEKGWRPPGL
jgi:hypothetical protein